MRFKLNQVVILEIIEELPEDRYIVSVEGNLIRTKMAASFRPSAGDTIQAKVIAIAPLQFQAAQGKKIGLSIDV